MDSKDEARPAGFAQIALSIVCDPALSPHAFRVYAIIRGHDFGRGDGCFVSRREVARMGGMSDRHVKRALAELRERGYIASAQSSDGVSTSRHYCLATGDTQSPPTAGEGPTGDTQSPHGGHTVPPTGDTQSPKVDKREVDKGSRSVGADAPRTDEETAAAKEEKRQADARRSYEKRPLWVQAFCKRAVLAMGWDLGNVKATTLEGWAPIVTDALATLSQQERERFGAWLFSSGYYRNGQGHQLRSHLRKECDDWLSADKPDTKIAAPVPKPKPARRTLAEEEANRTNDAMRAVDALVAQRQAAYEERCALTAPSASRAPGQER